MLQNDKRATVQTAKVLHAMGEVRSMQRQPPWAMTRCTVQTKRAVGLLATDEAIFHSLAAHVQSNPALVNSEAVAMAAKYLLLCSNWKYMSGYTGQDMLTTFQKLTQVQPKSEKAHCALGMSCRCGSPTNH